MKQSCKSICSYCGVGCGVTVELDATGAVHVDGDADHPSNMGMLCSKGKHLGQVVNDRSDRLRHPEMRASRGHPLKRVTWDDAIGRTAAVFRSIIDRFGPDAVALYVSGQLLTEEYYVANKLMKGFIGSNNIDTNSRLCMSSAVAAHKKVFGDDLVPACYDDIEHADCFLIAGANPAWCHPILFRRIEKRKTEHPDARIIVIDPRRTATCEYADLHLSLKPGTDITLYNAIARVLIERDWIDKEFIGAHTEGFDAVKDAVFETSVFDAAERCGLTIAEIELAARMIGESENMLAMWAMGLNQSAEGVNKNLAFLNLSLITGNIGRPGAGPLSLTGQPNAMGGREVGGLANLLAAHRDLASPEQRDFVSAYWGSGPIAPNPGLTATEVIDELESGKLKAIWIVCTNPAVSLPSLDRVERALNNARFVVVQDISQNSDTLAYADVVLPAAGWLEKCGTMTNSERRTAYLPKLVDPPGEALPDYEIFCRFAKAMGWTHAFDYSDEAAVYSEHASLTKGTAIDASGLSHKRLAEQGTVQWPCVGPDGGPTERLFTDGRFATPNGRAKLHGVRSEVNSEPTDEERPILLTTGRLRDQWHTMTRTGKVSKLNLHATEPYVELSTLDAYTRGISEGQPVTVESAQGTFQGVARITEAVTSGTAFAPMHWGIKNSGRLGRANNLTSTRIDPVSKQPDYKLNRVEIRAFNPRPRHIVVVGAGAAAFGFVEAMQQKHIRDEITVIGAEPEAFYNRVMLPGLVAGQHSWTDLVRTKPDGHIGVKLLTGARVTRIDRTEAHVVLADGRRIPYDKLILATGSDANTPDPPLGTRTDVYTLRNRHDAERIVQRANEATSAVVVGGGLLGIEAADALNANGLDTIIVHRSERLMGRQIDMTASRMLQRALNERGIHTLLNDGVARATEDGRLTGIWTRSGQYIEAGLIVWATGVTPCCDLARESGLEVRQGAVVDKHLRTNDENIYAIGEVAEFEHRRWGQTKAAHEQAIAAAAHLAGETWSNYKGSLDFNVLKIRDFSLCSIGEISAKTTETHEITAVDEARGYYKRVYVRDDRVIGAILVGASSDVSRVLNLIESRTELQGLRRDLLEGAAGDFKAMAGQLVCSCNGIGSVDIEDAINDGATDLESLCDKTKAGTSCGSCRPELLQMIGKNQSLPTEVALT